MEAVIKNRLENIPLELFQSHGHLGRDRFDSAGRRITSVSSIDLPVPIPEDPLPSSAPLRGRR